MKVSCIICLLTAVCASMVCGSVSGQPADSVRHGGISKAGSMYLKQLQKRDSVLIADQMQYGFRMDGVKAGTEIWLPESTDVACDSVEIVRDWKIDTLKVDKKSSSVDIETYLVVTSFDQGRYRLPDIAVRRVNPDKSVDTLVFEGLELDVKTIPVDTATFEVHDIKGQIRYPLTFREMLPYMAGVAALAGLIALAVWLIRKYRRQSDESAEKEPAYIVALKKLEKYRSSKYWAPDRQKLFYSGVTDALREYIAARFGVGAMEMTTAEIFDGLKEKDIPADLLDGTRELFVMSDLVKFAKMTVSDDENAKAVPSAVRFVTATWKEEESSAEAAGNDVEKEGENVL